MLKKTQIIKVQNQQQNGDDSPTISQLACSKRSLLSESEESNKDSLPWDDTLGEKEFLLMSQIKDKEINRLIGIDDKEKQASK